MFHYTFRPLYGHPQVFWFTHFHYWIVKCDSYLHTIYLSIYLWPYSPFLDLGRFSSFLIFYTFGRTPWTGDQPVAKPLPAHRTAQTQNKRTQISKPQLGFEPTIPVSGRAKTVHALDPAATVIGHIYIYRLKLILKISKIKLIFNF
jgi:hypothetical protein